MELSELDFFLLILSRIGFSILFGFILGFEREVTGKFAGLRTHILVCVGACAFTLLSIYGFRMHNIEGLSGINDPARIGAQIITGIGFIGAGTVMRHGTNVLGITTAATLWVCAAVGMACGCGMFIIAAVTSVFSLIVLILIRKFESSFLLSKSSETKTLEIGIWAPVSKLDDINKTIDEGFSKAQSIKRSIINDTVNETVVIKLKIVTDCTLTLVNDIFSNKDFIKRIEITEICD